MKMNETLTTGPLFHSYAQKVVRNKLAKDHIKNSDMLTQLYDVLREKVNLPSAPFVERAAKAGEHVAEGVAEAKRKDAMASRPATVEGALQDIIEAAKPVTVQEARAHIMKVTGLTARSPGMPGKNALWKRLKKYNVLKQ